VPGIAAGYYAPYPCYQSYAWRPAYCFAPVYGGYYGTGYYYAPYRFYGARNVVVRGRFDRDDFRRDRDGDRDGRRDFR
jgi:hypothetical protein